MPKATNGRSPRRIPIAGPAKSGRVTVTLDGYLALDAEAKALREKLAHAEVENQVWRELIAEFRDLITANAMQHLPHSKQFKRIRLCMSDPDFLEAEVRALAEKNRKIMAPATVA